LRDELVDQIVHPHAALTGKRSQALEYLAGQIDRLVLAGRPGGWEIVI
jgi:hypothetical protein